jgi:hypothetical protein
MASQIMIAILHRDPSPTHFHATYGEFDSTVRIEDGIEGQREGKGKNKFSRPRPPTAIARLSRSGTLPGPSRAFVGSLRGSILKPRKYFPTFRRASPSLRLELLRWRG